MNQQRLFTVTLFTPRQFWRHTYGLSHLYRDRSSSSAASFRLFCRRQVAHLLKSWKCSNCSKSARGVERRISGRIEARVWFVVSGGDPPRFTVGGGSDLLPPNYRFSWYRKGLFCRLLSAKLKIHKYRMHGGWQWTCDKKQIIYCQWARGLRRSPEGVEI